MNNSNVNWTATHADAVAAADGEFILPNDLPDVKRIVNTVTQVSGCRTFLEGQTVSAEGELCVKILFTGDDSNLHCAGYKLPFSVSAALRESDGARVAAALYGQPDTQTRLSNPRKFSVRIKVPVVFAVRLANEWEPFIDGVQDSGLQYKTVTTVTYAASTVTEDDIPYAEDLHIPESYPEPDRMICGIFIPSAPVVSPSDGTAEITFNADAVLLYLTEDGVTECFKTQVTVTHQTDDDSITPGSVCSCRVYVKDQKFSLTTDKSGRLRTVELDVTYSVSLLCETEKELTYTEDMFSTEKYSSAEYGDITLRRVGLPYTTHVTVSGETKAIPDTRIITATSACRDVNCERTNGQTAVGGVMDAYIVYEESGEYKTLTVPVPFRVMIPYSSPENSELYAYVTSGSPNVRADGDKIYVDAELYIRLCAESTCKDRAVTVFRISDRQRERDKTSLRLYRPNGETVWSVAKKFGVPVAELEKYNGGTDGTVLIIP